jgi:hypothetical protein
MAVRACTFGLPGAGLRPGAGFDAALDGFAVLDGEDAKRIVLCSKQTDAGPDPNF